MTSKTLTVQVNGEQRDFAGGVTLAEIVHMFVPSARGCAAAVNGEIFPKATWSTMSLRNGDHVEILSAAPGG